jgi:hypothetical protein
MFTCLLSRDLYDAPPLPGKYVVYFHLFTVLADLSNLFVQPDYAEGSLSSQCLKILKGKEVKQNEVIKDHCTYLDRDAARFRSVRDASHA